MGYTGLEASFRKILPDKEPANGCLTSQQNVCNKKISSDRVLIEKYFGRLCTFPLFGSKWRWDEHRNYRFLPFGVAFTNAHVVWNPLRRSDRASFNSIHIGFVFLARHNKKTQ